MSINSLLAKLGTSDNVMPYKKLVDLVENFDINKFSSGLLIIMKKIYLI